MKDDHHFKSGPKKRKKQSAEQPEKPAGRYLPLPL